MEEECRVFVEKRTTLDVDSSEYNIPAVCESIVAFMINKGFGPSPSTFPFTIAIVPF